VPFCHIADIEPEKLVSLPPSDLPVHVAKLHEDNGFGAEEEYEVSMPRPLAWLAPLSVYCADRVLKTWIQLAPPPVPLSPTTRQRTDTSISWPVSGGVGQWARPVSL
jgi:hypothetical protein